MKMKFITIIALVAIALVFVSIVSTNIYNLFKNQNQLPDQITSSINSSGVYKINTKCQFTYLTFKHLMLNRITLSPIMIRDAYDYQTQKQLFKEMQSLQLKYQNDQSMGTKNQTVQHDTTHDAYNSVFVPHFMDKYSINPKLLPLVSAWLGIVDESISPILSPQERNEKIYNLLHPTEEDHKTDPICVKRLESDFGDVLNNLRS